MKDRRLWNKNGHSFQTDIVSHKIMDNFWCIWLTQKLILGTVLYFTLKKGPLESSSCYHNPHLLNRNDYIMVNICLWRWQSISRTEPIRIFSWGLRIKRFGSWPDEWHTKVVGPRAEKAIFNCTHAEKVIVKKKKQWRSYIRKWSKLALIHREMKTAVSSSSLPVPNYCALWMSMNVMDYSLDSLDKTLFLKPMGFSYQRISITKRVMSKKYSLLYLIIGF